MAPAWLRLAALVVAAAPHLVAGADLVDGANEKYVIQAFDYEHAGAIDAASPDGASTVALTEGAASTRVDYAVARTGKRKGVAQMDDGRCAPVAGVVFDASRATRVLQTLPRRPDVRLLFSEAGQGADVFVVFGRASAQIGSRAARAGIWTAIRATRKL